jgi:c-di-GMP-binding flagellar brake protein YcgR
VVTNLRRMLACEVPASAGDRLRWKRGARAKAVFWRHGDSGYAFMTKILGYEKMQGRSVFLLQHSQTLRRSQRRAHRRRELSRSCFFFPILVLTSGRGRRARKRAVVQENFRHVGKILDVSGGGCAIESQTPLQAGKLLRIDFELDRRRRITAYGKVRRTTRGAGRRGDMHVMFTRVSSRNMNQILSFVYDFGETGSERQTLTRRLTRAGLVG